MSWLPEKLEAPLHQLTKELDVPFFLYDLDALKAHIASLQQQDIRLWYAVKANPLSAVIQTLAEQGMGFDVASQGELEQVLANISAQSVAHIELVNHSLDLDSIRAAKRNQFKVASQLLADEVPAPQPKREAASGNGAGDVPVPPAPAE